MPSKAVTIRPATWVRAGMGLGFFGGVLILLVGLGSLGNDDLGLAIYGLAAGPLVLVMTVLGLRISVRCDEKGVRVRTLRSVFIPVSEIDHLSVIPASNQLSMPCGKVAVVRTNGTMVKLEATYVVRMSEAAATARLHTLTEQLTAVLGLPPQHDQAQIDLDRRT
jgi:hypothetical protein